VSGTDAAFLGLRRPIDAAPAGSRANLLIDINTH
jgi:hypothetical protein